MAWRPPPLFLVAPPRRLKCLVTGGAPFSGVLWAPCLPRFCLFCPPCLFSCLPGPSALPLALSGVVLSLSSGSGLFLGVWP
ncbi:hypothetical protein DSO57_1038268 [Entomophthora muscae]|uniref:Uncharacterized protein n=1 Tax=Entomophthora muscae TaxID=34485 RepID=A0ACC2TA46_9FUNG|nr:hypothetical protein DSO57_1038268 [Entomophthora muscae]